MIIFVIFNDMISCVNISGVPLKKIQSKYALTIWQQMEHSSLVTFYIIYFLSMLYILKIHFR